MTPAEAGQLLARCAVFDNRRPSEGAAQGWAAALADVPCDQDAYAAVARFYGTPPADPSQRKWMEPHHVRSLRDEIRRERAAGAGHVPGAGLPAQVPDADPDDVTGYLAALRQQRVKAADVGEQLTLRPVAELTAAVGRSVPGPSDRQREQLAAAVPRFAVRRRRWPELAVPCPKEGCRAPVDRPCVRRSGATLLDHTHHSRRAAWVMSVAVCPACQVAVGTPCRTEHGDPLPDLIHPGRDREAVFARTDP